MNGDGDLAVEGHRTSLYLVGIVCAFMGAILMFAVSQSIFRNFVHYLDKLISIEARRVVPMSPASDFGHNHIEVSLPDFIRHKSPKKNRNSPIKRKYDSVSSFRALLDRDSDSSMIHLMNVPDNSGNDSDAQMSMSTAANLLNQTDRGMLNLSS